MGTDCVDICDAVLEVMCHPCRNWKKCQNAEDEANHKQMILCMGSLKMTEYPEDFEPIYENCCVCGKPAEGGGEECECTCPTCGEPCFDDSEFGDHKECRDCHKARISGQLCAGCDRKLADGDIFKCSECGERFCSDCMDGEECHDCHRKKIQGTTYGLRDMGDDGKRKHKKK